MKLKVSTVATHIIAEPLLILCSVTSVFSENGVVGNDSHLDSSSSVAVTQFEKSVSTITSPKGQDSVSPDIFGARIEDSIGTTTEHLLPTTAANVDPVNEDKAEVSLSVFSQPDRGESTIILDKINDQSTLSNENNPVEYLIGRSDVEDADEPMYGKFGKYLRYGNKMSDDSRK